MQITKNVAAIIAVIVGLEMTAFGLKPTQTRHTAAPVKKAIPAREELIKALNDEARKRGVFWQVWCVALYEGDEEKYQGIATRGKLFNIYAEEGAGPYWQVYGYKSQDEAAWALIKALKGPPNAQPQHKDRMRAICPPPLKGQP